MKRLLLLILLIAFLYDSMCGQESNNQGSRMLFHGLVMDKQNETFLPNVQIFINKTFSSVSNNAGRFSFYAGRNDTVIFRLLGYKPAYFYISDTLTGKEFVAGIYMSADTISIDEVVILPRLSNLKADMFSPRSEESRQIQNASNNMAISAYSAKITQNKLGDPALNYEVIRQRQKDEAYTKGQIPSDRMVGLSPLMLIPAAYMLLNGLPEKPAPFQQGLTEQEVNEIHKRYLESARKK
ncbi:MAG: carboxypeptidase-like regulatory domain-containing protein [Bacteroidales bacterium]